ncbi:hypothetical protein SeMB42_g04760 [Synchytrium endobioticum]|uniref:Anaphase-promoting complex subunit 4-like WD40 domain-containing protein n=1 Tax=Synchytrium endobioticum TaxID=286115 RepID=A0A507CW13_9FUNG|nr:hypothetical protein SeMB42_g04760 [Synchytrium endobioticum]TPX49870.1 hypothetical protein SeLEV6574_g01227 [Synchytrium endobioticum]
MDHVTNNEASEDTDQTIIASEDVAEVVHVCDDGPEPMDEDDDMDDSVADIEVTEARAADQSLPTDDSIQAFTDHHEPVYSVAINPMNPLMVLSGGGNDQSFIWRLDTGEKVFDIPPHSDSVSGVQFSNDGRFAASGSMDGKIHVVSTDNGNLIATVEGPNEVACLEWHPRGAVLLAGGEDGSLWMWALPAGICMNVFINHTLPVTCGSFTPDGKHIVSASEDKSFILWDPKTAAVVTKISNEDARFHQNVITAMDVHKDSTLVMTGDSDGSARLVHLGNGKILGALENHSDSIEAVGFCESMPWAATGSVDGCTSVWDVHTLRLRSTLRHDDAVTSIRWHPSRPLLYSASADKTVRLWDIRTGNQERIWTGHQAPILTMDVSKDGSRVVTGSDDGSALVFAFE